MFPSKISTYPGTICHLEPYLFLNATYSLYRYLLIYNYIVQ